MNLLLTADTQADRNNLELCEQSLQELLVQARKQKPDAIIHAGDAKDSYDPIPGMVVKWWMRAIKTIVGEGFRFIIMLGNHDRLSQSHESKNWLDILRAAGAEVVAQPRQKVIGDGCVSFLPFTADKKLELKWAKQLARNAQRGKRVLIFHTGLCDAVMNSSGLTGLGVLPESLLMDEYDACFGGHYHTQQRVGDRNVWYIGSPFCHSWNECNEIKGFVSAFITREGVRVKQIKTQIPHWYDYEYLVKHKLVPEPGAYIRRRVPVTSKKITDTLRKAEDEIHARFPGSRLHVIPKVAQLETQEIPLTGTTDRAKVEQYVAATFPEAARFRVEQVVTYLSSKLSMTAPAVPGRGPRFIKIEGRNVLSFERIKFRYAKQGLILLHGENKDWPKHSNGSGKTNMLSLLPLAITGRTLKGQRAQQWAREAGLGTATLILTAKDHLGRLVEIERGRPHRLLLRINGDDKSSGITGIRAIETQGIIEELLGFDEELLLNSVYIDQTIANGFVFGTKSQRLDLVNKIERLERYELASKVVAKDIAKNDKAATELEFRISQLSDAIDSYEEDIKSLGTLVKHNWDSIIAEREKEMRALAKEHATLSGASQFYEEMRLEYAERSSDLLRLISDKNTLLQQQFACRDLKARGDKLSKAGKCPTCGQTADAVGKEMADGALAAHEIFQVSIDKFYRIITTKEERNKARALKIVKYDHAIADCDQALSNARDLLRQAKQGAEIEETANAKVAQKQSKLQRKIAIAKRSLAAAQRTATKLGIDRELLEYSKKALLRSGMPMYLSAALCPVLNKAAEEYSDIFTDGRIKLNFYVQDGEFNADVINPSGSETSDGQSTGECALAGTIAAFSVRETAPRTNILILDEPGAGLDPEAAKQFANGLLKLKDRFETIIVTTHNQTIEAVLSGEKRWTVEKKDGISSLVQ